MTTGIRLGIVGGGQVGQAAVKDAGKIQGVETVGLAEPGELLRDHLGREFGMAVFPTLEAMLRQARLDAVKICTPNSLHAQQAIACLEAGVHVLCEKPLATSPADAERVLETAQRSGKVFMVNYEYRFSRLFARIKELLDADEIGEVRNFWFYESRGGFFGPEGGWRFTKGGSGGLFGEKLGHYIDLVHWYSESDFRRVRVMHGSNTLPHYQIPDHTMAFFELAGGQTFTLLTHHGLAADAPNFALPHGSPVNLEMLPRLGHMAGFRICGTKGSIISDDWRQTITINRLVKDYSGLRGGWRMEHERTEDFSGHDYSENVHNQAGMLAQFLDHCRRAEALIYPPAAQLLAVMAAVGAAERSVENQTAELIELEGRPH